MPHRFALSAVIITASMLLTACSSSSDAGAPDTTSTTTTTAAVDTSVTPTDDPPPDGSVWTVSGPATGNRVGTGSGDIQATAPIDVELSGTPLWVVGAPSPNGVLWVVALEDGRLEGWHLGSDGAASVELNISQLPAGTPPVVIETAAGAEVVAPPPDASSLSYPLPTGDGGLAYVTSDGSLIVQTDSGRNEYQIAALPDARITQSSDGRIAVLAEATTRYPHGVLGDDLEAGRLVIIDPSSQQIVGEAIIPEPSVIEGVAALWADVDGDGTEEILVTVSNSEVGAGLVVFDRHGRQVAVGPPIGRGGRWRNQLGAGPVGPNGEIEVIDVRVPHIGGVVEYFRLDGEELALATQQEGFTSHVFGSRNLDMALAVDVSGDGAIDVVVPNQELTVLGVLSRTPNGVVVAGELALPGRLATNLATAFSADGQLWLAAATADGVLRVWSAG